MSLDPAVAVTLRAGLALLLLAASLHKVRDLPAFRAALANYRLLPARWTLPVSGGLALAELVIGLALVVPRAGSLGAVAAVVLLLTYSAAVAINLLRGRRQIDCACMGPGARRPLSEGLLLRNAALVAAAALSALPAADRSLVWMDGLTMGVGFAVLVLLYRAVDRAIENASRLSVPGGRTWSTH